MTALVAPSSDGTLELIARVARSEPSAVRELAHRLLPVVRARVRRLQARRADVRQLETADLVQHVFVRLLEDGASQLRKWDPARGASLEGYVGMVSEREAGNCAQRAGTREQLETPAATSESPAKGPSPEREVIVRDTARRLVAHLSAQLPPKGQLVMQCLYADGLGTDETAQMLGVNRQVVYNWQHRIRALAREFLPVEG